MNGGAPERAPALESRTVHSGHHASRRKTARSRKSTSRSVCGARAVSASSARKTLTRCFKLFVSVGALPPPPDGSEHSRGMSYECWEGSGAISNLEHEFRTTHPQRCRAAEVGCVDGGAGGAPVESRRCRGMSGARLGHVCAGVGQRRWSIRGEESQNMSARYYSPIPP